MYKRQAYDEVLGVFSEVLSIERELEALETELRTGEASLSQIERQVELTERHERLGGLTCRSRTRSTLLGPGFDEAHIEMPVGCLLYTSRCV